MPVPSNLSDLSPTAANNYPAATDTISTTDDYLRSHAAILAKISDGTNALVSPALTTPSLGAATATTINKVTITAPATSAVLTVANGKTLTASNTLTLAGTDGTTMTFPALSGTVLTSVLQSDITGNTKTVSGLLSLSAGSLVATDITIGTTTSTGATGTGKVVFGTSPTIGSPTINGTIATTGLTLPAFTLGGAITGGGQNVSGLGTLGCGAITSSGAISGTSLSAGTGALTAGNIGLVRTALSASTILRTMEIGAAGAGTCTFYGQTNASAGGIATNTIFDSSHNAVYATSAAVSSLYLYNGETKIRYAAAGTGGATYTPTDIATFSSTGLSLGSLALTAGSGTFSGGTTAMAASTDASIVLTAAGNNTKYAGIWMDGSTTYNTFFGRAPTALAGEHDSLCYVTIAGGTPTLRAKFSSTGLAVTGTLSATNNIANVAGTGTNSSYIRLNNTGGNFYVGRDNSAGNDLASGSSAYAGIIDVVSAHPLHFATTNVVRMTLDASGNLGVGTASPARKLVVYADTSPTIQLADATSGVAAGAGSVFQHVTATQHLIIRNYGASGYITFETNGAERLRLDASGNLGLGVTTPSTYSSGKALEIGFTGAGVNGYSQTQTIYSSNSYYNGAYRFAGASAGYAAVYTQNAGNHYWYTSPTSGTTGTAYTPTQVLGVELGKSLALQGATSQTGTGITFPATQSASSDANTLDDYEEGTWTPALTASGSTPTHTPTASGTYTKIGNRVIADFDLTWTGLSGGSGTVRISLPFTATGGRGGNVFGNSLNSPTGAYNLNFEAAVGASSYGTFIWSIDSGTWVNLAVTDLPASGGIRGQLIFYV